MNSKETRLLGTTANLVSEAALLNRQVASFLDPCWLKEEKDNSFKELKDRVKHLEELITYVKESLGDYETK